MPETVRSDCLSTLNNPFFVSLAEGAEESAEKEGVKLAVADAGDDSAKQQNDIEDLISRNISVLIVNPVDSDAVAPAVQNAVSQGIKVISVDRVVNGVEVDCQIASDRADWRRCEGGRASGSTGSVSDYRQRRRFP